MAIQLYFKNQLTHIKVAILYMMPKLLINANRDTMLNLGCDCGVCILNMYMKLELSKMNVVDPKNILQVRFDLLGGLYDVQKI
jgi:hypothetical protein